MQPASVIRSCQNSVSTASNHFLLSLCFFAERGEVSVGGKCPPARPQHLYPLNFLCSPTGLVGTWGHFHTCLVTCVTIVSDPATGSCSPPNTCVHLHVRLLCFVFQHERIAAQIWEPPSFVATVFLFLTCLDACVFGPESF